MNEKEKLKINLVKQEELGRQVVKNIQDLMEIYKNQSELFFSCLEDECKKEENKEMEKVRISRQLDEVMEEGKKGSEEIKTMLFRLQEEISGLKEMAKKKEKLEREKKDLQEALDALKKETEKTGFCMEEVGDDIFHGYQEYCAWREKKGKDKQAFLSQVRGNTFLAYIKSCSRDKVFQYIFDNMKTIVWNPEMGEDIKAIDRLIDNCIAIQYKTDRRKFRRQRVAVGTIYDSTCHCKRENDSGEGKITKVLLSGVEWESGQIVDGCRAFVEVG